MNDTILIIATGGTFDKQYDELKGELTFKGSHLQKIMQVVRCTLPYRLQYLTLKDSLFMDESDRQQIIEACREFEGQRIVVIHGTDTMEISARVVGNARLEKTIVFTGAMVPYSVSDSDAVFNLGTAIASATLLEPGVYISMNARIFSSHDVKKDRAKGVFMKASEALD